jgi:hypothetical protein
VDWDNDGAKDLLVGAGDGGVYIYGNIGTNMDNTPVFDDGTVVLDAAQTGNRATPVMADWDGNGTQDLLVGNLDGNIQIYLNQGSSSVPSFSTYSLLQVGGGTFDIGTRAAPRIYDWNGDGLKDILVGEVSGYIYYLQNVGTNSAPVFNTAEKLLLLDGTALRYLTDPANANYNTPRSRFDITDWNNDGYADIVVGGQDGRVMLFLTKCTDDDGDGYAIEGGMCGLVDCDDNNEYINPDAHELPGNTIDENCNGYLACDPSDYWKNHGKFVSCVAHKTNHLVRKGFITNREGRLLKRAAAKSDVGKKGNKHSY